MKSKLPVSVKFGAGVLKAASAKSAIPIGTWWEFEHHRNGELIDKWGQKNVTTSEGIKYILEAAFDGGTQIDTWYIGLFEDDYSPRSSDRYVLPGFTESTAYEELTRVAFDGEVDSSGLMIDNNDSKAEFTMNATKTIYGAFLCGGGTDPEVKEDTAGGGVLLALSKFAAAKSVVDEDVLLVSCSVTLASAS